MGYWKTKVIDGSPRFSDKPGCHYRLSPDGLEAIIEITGARADYDEMNTDPDTVELTRREAEELSRSWNQS